MLKGSVELILQLKGPLATKNIECITFNVVKLPQNDITL